MDEDEELKDLLKRKVKLSKDSHKLGELGDLVYRIGYLHYNKGYYKEALEEFENALTIRKKLPVSADIANTYRMLGETLSKLGTDFEKAKQQLSMYYAIAMKLKDLVLIQQAHTTLGNYYLVLCDFKDYKMNRTVNLNEAYTHYLKSYDILSDIHEKRLVDAKEFAIMKARSCLNCAFVLDEKRDLIICNEYLKTAIEICEKHTLYEDLIRCFYIKCDHAKRKNKMEETLKWADRIVEITKKTKDYIQQSQDFAFVADLYIKIQNFEKAKIFLRQAYKLKNKCLISVEITSKLKHVMNILKRLNEVAILNTNFQNPSQLNTELKSDMDKSLEVSKCYEKLADSYCYIGLYEQGLSAYLKQLEIAKFINGSSSELAIIFSSIAQTYLDLNDFKNALVYYQYELDTNTMSAESACVSLLNVASIQEKLSVDFVELKEVFMNAYKKAKETSKVKLQIKVMKALKEAEMACGVDSEETQKTLNSLNEIKRIRGLNKDGDLSSSESDKSGSSGGEEEEEDNVSIVFSSESEEDEKLNYETMDAEKGGQKTYKTRTNAPKKYVVKKNLRGETNLHVACIKGNFNQVKKLLEEGHPPNERDNMNWLPIHEACNYGHVEIVEALIKYGAKINDMMGPMPPLHDAAQNGHLEVVKLLLKAGALPYSFDHDGYTPLDQLCYYKQHYINDKTDPSELQLFKECYDKMLSGIRSKDQSYKIKKVISKDGNAIVDEEEYQEMEKSSTTLSSSRRYKKGATVGLDDYDSDEDAGSKSKKRNAIVDYKKTITNIGSRNASTGYCTTGKKMTDKVIITESEKDASDDWLINDMDKKTKVKHASTNKRKSYHFSDTESDQERSPQKLKSTIIDSDLEDSLPNLNLYDKSSGEQRIKSPLSKKRFIEDDSQSSDIFQTNEDSSSAVLCEVDKMMEDYSYDTQSYTKMSREIREMNEQPVKIYNAWNKTAEDDITVVSPFKNKNYETNYQSNNQGMSTKHKTQLKLTKMQGGIQRASSKENMTRTNKSSQEVKIVDSKPAVLERAVPETISKVPEQPVATIEPSKQSWKVKAIIDNRNFLIPVPNINATIDALSTQITTRYKAIFKNDPSFREPDNVILKSADDLILFGEDLIKDVLTDMCQVHLIIETCKNAPTLSELYEKNCQENNIKCYENIKLLLKESESSFVLNLRSLFIDNSTMSSQLDVIFDSMNTVAKQQGALNNDYCIKMSHIDLASNLVTDQRAIALMEKVFAECPNVKTLDLSQNLISSKTLTFLCDLISSSKMSSKAGTLQLDTLILNGNDLGSLQSTHELLTTLNNLLTSFPLLKKLHLSDCKITLNDTGSDDNSLNETAWKKLLNSFKASKLIDVDMSYNQFSQKYLSGLVESLPDYQIESLNMSNSLIKRKNNRIDAADDFINSFTKFIGSSLISLSLRGLDLSLMQTSTLIDHLCSCKKLKSIDLSYNSFSKDSIQNLFFECLKIEEARLVNHEYDEEDSFNPWSTIVKIKFSEENSAPLKQLELKVKDQNERSNLKSCFKSEWQKNFVKIMKPLENHNNKNSKIKSIEKEKKETETKMKLNIYIQLFEQCNQLAIEVKSIEDLTDEFTLFDFINGHDEIKMETDADMDVLDYPELMIEKIRALAEQYLPASKDLLLVFRDKISPSIQTKSPEDLHKELSQSLNDDFTTVACEEFNDKNKIQVFFETEAEILSGFIEKNSSESIESRNLLEEIQQAVNLRKLFYNKHLTCMNVHCCLIDENQKRVCLQYEETINLHDLNVLSQIWIRERKEESFETLLPRKLYKSLELEMVKTCFETGVNYHESSRLLRTQARYMEKLLEGLSDDQNDESFSPYTVIAQSSGYGKSRTFDLLSENYFVVYTCLKQLHLTSFPRATKIGSWLMSDVERENFIKNIEAFYLVYIEEILGMATHGNKTPTQFFRMNETYYFQKDIEAKIKAKRSLLKGNQDESEEMPASIIDSKKIIFVFDEAMCLASSREATYTLFNEMTKLIKKFRKSSFTLFIDASLLLAQESTSLCNYELTDNDEYLHGYEPIYMLPTFDINYKRCTIINIVQATVLKNVCRYGRPLWGVWIKAHAEKKKIRKVVVGKIVLIAIERLVGNKDWNALKLSDLKLNDILAVLASRLQLAVNPYSKICIEMIAKNLATCVRVVEGSDSVEIMYPSEPILAEASARLLNKFDDWSFFIKIMDKAFNSSMLIGDVTNRKSIAVQTMFLMAWDRNIDNHDIEYRVLSNQHLNYSRYAKVSDFLSTLFGDKVYLKVATSKSRLFKEAYMYFTHFAEADLAKLTKEKLIEAMRRGCALVPKKNKASPVDIVIPITFSEEDFSKMSVLLVKVNKDESRVVCAEDMVNISGCFFGYEFSECPEIVLYIDLKAPSADKKVKSINDAPNYKEMQLSIEPKKGRIHFVYDANQQIVDKINEVYMRKKFTEEEELEKQKFEEKKLANLKQSIEQQEKIDPLIMTNLMKHYSRDQIKTHFKDYYLKFLKFVYTKQLSIYIGSIEPLTIFKKPEEIYALNGLLNEDSLQGNLFEVYFNEHELVYSNYLQECPFEKAPVELTGRKGSLLLPMDKTSMEHYRKFSLF